MYIYIWSTYYEQSIKLNLAKLDTTVLLKTIDFTVSLIFWHNRGSVFQFSNTVCEFIIMFRIMKLEYVYARVIILI